MVSGWTVSSGRGVSAGAGVSVGAARRGGRFQLHGGHFRLRRLGELIVPLLAVPKIPQAHTLSGQLTDLERGFQTVRAVSHHQAEIAHAEIQLFPSRVQVPSVWNSACVPLADSHAPRIR